MELFYDERDDKTHESRGSRILYWLDDLGAKPLQEARPEDEGFLFAGARSEDDYRKLTAPYPLLRDRAEDRTPLLKLDATLDALSEANVAVPTPRTWRLPLDARLPADLTYPLFVRAANSSLKLGGEVSKVKNESQLISEAENLRRALGWNAVILAREWHNLAEAGQSRYGSVPQEIRVWIVDGQPFAWSFHYLNVVRDPSGFPPSPDDLQKLESLSTDVAEAFHSRCIVADFAREMTGRWIFIEAGPGSCAGTAHEYVFKAVATRLRGDSSPLSSDSVGGLL